jgi:hypothetical protein
VTVVAVFAGILWMLGFFKREELGILARLRPARLRTAAPGETTELAGEIIAAALPEADLSVPGELLDRPVEGSLKR